MAWTPIGYFPGVLSPGLIAALIVLAVWEIVWKAIALWKCGRNNQLVWFIFIAILNTIGILPIIYLLFFQKNKNNSSKVKRKR